MSVLFTYRQYGLELFIKNMTESYPKYSFKIPFFVIMGTIKKVFRKNKFLNTPSQILMRYSRSLEVIFSITLCRSSNSLLEKSRLHLDCMYCNPPPYLVPFSYGHIFNFCAKLTVLQTYFSLSTQCIFFMKDKKNEHISHNVK